MKILMVRFSQNFTRTPFVGLDMLFIWKVHSIWIIICPNFQLITFQQKKQMLKINRNAFC